MPTTFEHTANLPTTFDKTQISNRRPRAATKSLRKSYAYEGPWVWLAYREGRYLGPFSTHIVAPYFLTFVCRVHSQTFEGGIGTLRFFANCAPPFRGIRQSPSENQKGAPKMLYFQDGLNS